MRKIVGLVIVFLLLVGFPLGSYLYLNKGYNERLDLIHSLDSLGQFNRLDQFPEVYERIDSSVIIAYFANATNQDRVLKTAADLNRQFNSNGYVNHLIHLVQSNEVNYAAFNGLDTLTYIDVLKLSDRINSLVMANAFNMPSGSDPFSYIVLIDRYGNVRTFAEMSDAERMKLFVRQMGVVLPKKKREIISLKREREK